VTGIIGGLLAALLWGSSTVTDARATRIVGTVGVLGWGSIAGCTLTLPVALIFAHDTSGVGRSGLVWLTVSSLAAVTAFAPFYRAVRLGPVPLVAGLGALEGAVAASISFATGERLPALTLLGLVIALGGMTFVLTSVRVPVPAGQGHPLQAGLLATLAASLFGLSLFAGARAIEQVPELWLPAGSRTFGTVLIALPLTLLGYLPRPGRFLRFVFYSALAQSTGYFAFLVAADSSGISVPAVLASQASVVGMVISFLVLGERLSHRQLAGIAALLTGVALVAATR
jgi:drug/metabolite transporter (DMT)-like permease